MTTHGYSAYSRGLCKCEVCTTAKRERQRLIRAAKLASGKFRHGLRASYDAGCRCGSCRDARAEAYDRLERGFATGGQVAS